MVLDIAKKHNLSVKVIDVNNPGADDGLVRRHVGSDGVLPLLVRPDGARLERGASFVPEIIDKFLVGS